MSTNKIAWLTDVHLNFLKKEARENFYQKVFEYDVTAVLITGDIAEAPTVSKLLAEFCMYIDKKIYFVLGNHDYYLGNISDVRNEIKELCNENKKLCWLGKPEIIVLNSKTVLVGHDGWADTRYGDFDRSRIALNDSRYIADLFQAACLGKTMLKHEMKKLADADATILDKTIQEAIEKHSPQKMIIATHVPPFKECCWYEGGQSNEHWQPYFSSKATGDVISAVALRYPEVNFLVLCGHTHTEHALKIYKNLEVKVGGAEYSQPQIQGITELST